MIHFSKDWIANTNEQFLIKIRSFKQNVARIKHTVNPLKICVNWIQFYIWCSSMMNAIMRHFFVTIEWKYDGDEFTKHLLWIIQALLYSITSIVINLWSHCRSNETLYIDVMHQLRFNRPTHIINSVQSWNFLF